MHVLWSFYGSQSFTSSFLLFQSLDFGVVPLHEKPRFLLSLTPPQVQVICPVERALLYSIVSASEEAVADRSLINTDSQDPYICRCSLEVQ